MYKATQSRFVTRWVANKLNQSINNKFQINTIYPMLSEQYACLPIPVAGKDDQDGAPYFHIVMLENQCRV